MTHRFAHYLGILAVGQGQGSVTMPGVVHPHLLHPGELHQPVEIAVEIVRADRPTNAISEAVNLHGPTSQIGYSVAGGTQRRPRRELKTYSTSNGRWLHHGQGSGGPKACA